MDTLSSQDLTLALHAYAIIWALDLVKLEGLPVLQGPFSGCFTAVEGSLC